ncbi:hypothetical protein ACOMHN_010264 [Nucella lapillus]
MESHFIQRGYDQQCVKGARTRASEMPRHETLTNRTKKDHNRTPVIVTHNPANPPLRLGWLTDQGQDSGG